MHCKAYDKNGVELGFGTTVSYVDTALKTPREKFGPIDQFTFKSDGSVVLHVTGSRNRAIPAESVEVVTITDDVQLVVDAFKKRGATISVSDASDLVSQLMEAVSE